VEQAKHKLNTGAEIPAIGFGTWQLSPAEARRSVAAALDIGYRLIDTAKLYGNEHEVGEAVRASGLDRFDIFVTTKLWNNDQGYGSALIAFDESLAKLGLEYIDLYLIHWPGYDKRLRLESWRALEEIYKSGRAKAVGVSNYEIHHLNELFEKSELKPAVNQVEFHPFIYGEQAELADFCKSHGIIFEAYSPLARGRLNDPLLAECGKKYGKTASQVMLRWAIQHGTIPLPRSSRAEHIRQNFDVFDFKLDDEDIAAIDNISPAGRTAWDPTGLP
jgi:diketogulonate reductase-like aldo/keto reductase